MMSVVNHCKERGCVCVETLVPGSLYHVRASAIISDQRDSGLLVKRGQAVLLKGGLRIVPEKSLINDRVCY